MGDFYNPALLAGIVGWAIAQIIKMAVHAIKYRKFNLERIWGSGGMPSSHSATVCALSVVVARTCGFGSSEFALAMTLSLIVMYDATGVRRAAGLHARELNRLREIVYDREDEQEALEAIKAVKEEAKDSSIPKVTEIDNFKKLKEYLGHTPLEVICGALLGIIVGLLFVL